MQEDLGGLSGMTLFLDLDFVIIGSIDPLFSHAGRFLIIKEWKDPHLGYGNSSVVRFFIGQESAVLDRFYATPEEEIVSRFDSKEQNFLSKAVDRGCVLAGGVVCSVQSSLLAAQSSDSVLFNAKNRRAAKSWSFTDRSHLLVQCGVSTNSKKRVGHKVGNGDRRGVASSRQRGSANIGGSEPKCRILRRCRDSD